MGMINAMADQISRPVSSPLPKREDSASRVRGGAFLMERLITVNALISLVMLTWSALVLRKPDRARQAWQHLRRAWPGLVGS